MEADSEAVNPASQRSAAEACASAGRTEAAPTDAFPKASAGAPNEGSGMPAWNG